MATIPTQDTVPSESPRDLKFNAGKIDEFVTSLVNTYIDRFGHEHYTIEGLRWLAQQAIAQYGWIPVSTFQAGATLTTPNQILKDTTDGEYYRWDGVFPKTVATGSTPASTGGTGVGAWLSVGDSTLRSWVNNNISINFSTVTNMIAGTAISGNTIPLINGMVATTFANQFGIKQESKWLISSTQDANTYSVLLANGGYANLICRADMNYAEFGFGGTDVQNVAAVDEGNRVARAQTVMRSLSFPAGVYNIGAFTLDVDKRAFVFDGAGWDATMLVSTTSGISMEHVLIDPRNRARDGLHFYQTVKGFTLDGNITNNGANAASRSICSAHYAEIAYKSIGHRLSNVDLCGLCIHWKGHTQGRTNGATSTKSSVRVCYNSIKLDGYIGGASSSLVNTLIHGPSTTFAVAGAIGDSAITVASSAGLSTGFIMELRGSTLEAKKITAINGNILTLDSPLTATHTVGSIVRLPVFGTSVTGTMEVGQIQIGNCSGTQIHGAYTEESRFYIFAYADSLEIHGNTIGESAPVITIDSTVDRLSTIRIVSNQTAFPININIKDRALGTVNANLDLYNFPELDIQQNTRAQQSILVNGTYAFKTLKVERFYNTSINDRSFTSFKFTGFSATQAISSATAILRFAQDSGLRGYDGHSYDLTAVIRRATGLSGILKRAGQTSIIGSTISDTSAANARTLNNYSFFSAVDGMDINANSNTGRMEVVLKGEPVGGQSITTMISGEVVSII
ncbi:tail fiber/spike domain-containing protein [Lelliottia amnigena]|uniref:tail fiber/spike domain-containing protein n=1 Tax=Lelliottia amnigena TaxID=61646 RepID=UPI0040567E4B